MYGGYGNIWNQGSTQWPSANVQNQNQFPVQNPQLAGTNPMNVAQTFQGQQQAMGSFGGQNSGAVGTNTTQAGMMGYMNMGMTANPYMNYGGNAAALMNANTNTAWLGNQFSFQQQQYVQSMAQSNLNNFPGGRPPLPPGPPPSDKPTTDTTSLNQKQGLFGIPNNPTSNVNSNLNKQPPLPPYANPSLHMNQQRPPPPPPPTNSNVAQPHQPPPPPPTGPPPSQTASQSLLGAVPGLIANTTMPSYSSLKPEDAYNIIKSAAALGILPSNGSLGPPTTLNVSEELFGSKNGKGIPGLDMEDDPEQDHKSPSTEVIDLEKEPEQRLKLEADVNQDPINKSSSKPPSEPISNDISKEGSSWSNASPIKRMPVPEAVKKPAENVPKKNELVWELRSDVQDKSWTRDVSPKPGTRDVSPKPDTAYNTNRWGSESSAKTASEKKFSDNDSGVFKINDETSMKEKSSKVCSSESKTDGKAVRIPLEPEEGKEIVYDRKSLKQFDKIFREWEAQFENWKKDNENHPNQNAYDEYLEQWNKWRKQLLEQRRSILDTMTKAKMDSKEILLAKIESIEDEEAGNPTVTSAQVSKESFPSNVEVQPAKIGNIGKNVDSINPFEAALLDSDGGKRATPLISSFESNKPLGVPPLIPGLHKKSQSISSNNERSDREQDRPVERISRNARNDQSGFENQSQNKTDVNPFDMASSFGDNRSGTRDSNTQQNKSDTSPFKMGRNSFGDNASATGRGHNQENTRDVNPFEMDSGSYGINTSSTREGKSMPEKDSFDSKAERVRIPFDWSLPSQNKPDNNPFAMASNNPFVQPRGQNPFEFKQQDKLPSLDDFIKQAKVEFPTSDSPPHNRQQQMMSSNPFSMNMSSTSIGERQNTSMRMETQVERIRRDPLGDFPNQNPSSSGIGKALRLEANPVGMPLLIASKPDTPPPKDEIDEISHLFSRDRGPVIEDSNLGREVRINDVEYVEEAEVIDYAANSMDDMDFPRGENPDTKEEDFSLEESDVIDYSQGIPPNEMEDFPGAPEYGEMGYQDDFNHGYPPYHETLGRGRGRGQPPGPWGRGYSRGYPPGHHMYGRGSRIEEPHYSEFGPVPPRGRPYARGMPMGRGGPEPQWYHHDDRNLMAQNHPPVVPPVVELSPSPSPEPAPAIKIAPPNPEFDRERRRSRSRERMPRGRDERSRSRSRERTNRRGRDGSIEKRERRRESSPYNSRRDRERDKRSSPDRRSRNDDKRDRDRDRDRDRHNRDRRARSKSPAEDRLTVVRNPLFPSASAGVLSSAASNPPPPRYQTVLIEDILNMPGRAKRPPRLVVFMRGLPGAGKSHCVGLIKEREVQMGGKAPRILSLDNYFMTEMEKKEKDPVTGVEIKKTVMEYEYDDEREPLYRAQLIRQFRKTLDEGYFSFVIVDCVNEYARHFDEMSSFATQKRFQVYVAEIEESVDVCVKRNIHKRSKEEILKISKCWERTPSNLIKLDTRTLLQDEAVQDVEMEDVSDVETDNNTEKALTPAERGKIGPQVEELEDIEDEDSGDHLLQSPVVSSFTSKWDTIEQSQEKLNKLDGLMKKRRTNDEAAPGDSGQSIEAWLTSNTPEDYVQRRETRPGQKRVRWADIEERREQEKMREMGFVVGHTDWKRMMDPTFGSSALTKTKFI
ncbi:unnamed protein product [Orchesella dallaii]|uniref:YLPM1-like spectrin repeat domain-containing protein n=1 Tax=Orchesella dallaii TaxID=48710 RepID=A0ABP1QYX6_9HEXA